MKTPPPTTHTAPTTPSIRGVAPTLASALSPPPEARARALYIHVPFCAHKCHYCDFYSFVDSQDRQEAFVAALSKELRWLGRWGDDGGGLTSVFVGGGTPSLLRVGLWERVFAALGEGFVLGPGVEFTVECNPESVTPELARALVSGGVNRVSLGAQSFNERHLKTLERIHTPGSVPRALDIMGEAGIERVSVDLIFGVPGQTMGEWRDDLGRALALPIEHVSCYCLTYEPNTAMTQRMRAGAFTPASDDHEADLYEAAVEMCSGAGLGRYEVSNFARPGGESRHNLAYWRNEAWLAAGPSASGHLGGHRWKNVPRLTDWMEGVNASGGASPITDHEPPDVRRGLADTIMMGIRIGEGVDGRALVGAAGAVDGVDPRALADEAEALMREGLIAVEGARWRPTDRGYLFADAVASRLMGRLGA